ncbi:hypothetical protein C8R46DRAFT_1324505 [Mycena filopes]|nr:hypothetical protein C8R46DRAFT_1324505 [Mycena filopes]
MTRPTPTAMHLSQSSTPMASPLSYNSAKLSHHAHYQHLQAPTTSTRHPPSLPTPWVPPAPLPHVASPIFAGEPQSAFYGSQSAGRTGYYQPAQLYAPSLPPVPLPRSHSHSSRHSSSPLVHIHLHDLLKPQRIEFHISVYPFTPDLLRVPQDLLFQAAFTPQQNTIELQLTTHNDMNLVVNASGPLTVAFILQKLHTYLHSPIPRGQFAALHPDTQLTAEKSYRRRRAQLGHAVSGQGYIFLEARGLDGMVFVGLKKGDEPNVWIPLFQTARHA